jgi:hypothetical protein
MRFAGSMKSSAYEIALLYQITIVFGTAQAAAISQLF